LYSSAGHVEFVLNRVSKQGEVPLKQWRRKRARAIVVKVAEPTRQVLSCPAARLDRSSSKRSSRIRRRSMSLVEVRASRAVLPATKATAAAGNFAAVNRSLSSRQSI
jgi:hypothetical protein